MSLLSICQNASNNLGVTTPTQIIGSTAPVAARLLQLARREAINLSQRTNWTSLIVEHVFFAAGTSDYPLPADYRSMIDDTMWDRSRFWRMRGAMTPQQWQMYKSSIIGRATVERRWRIRVPSGAAAGAMPIFSIDPPLSGPDTSPNWDEANWDENNWPYEGDTTSEFVFEYVSKNWCQSATTFSVDELVPVEQGSGFAVGDQFSIVGGTVNTAAVGIVTALTATNGIATAEVTTSGSYIALPASPAAMVAVTGVGANATFLINATTSPGVTQSDWMADTDTAIIDESLIELGVIWRLARRLGLSYDEELNEYEVQVRQAIARDGGTAILNLAPYDRLTLVGPYNVQEGNFPG
jgi:hypothetical protein